MKAISLLVIVSGAAFSAFVERIRAQSAGRAGLDRRLERLDRNRDGQLTGDEGAPAAVRIADRLDANDDGVITAREAGRSGVSGMRRRGAAGLAGVPTTPNRSAVRPHGQEAVDAGLDSKVLAGLAAVLRGHVDAKNVAGSGTRPATEDSLGPRSRAPRSPDVRTPTATAPSPSRKPGPRCPGGNARDRSSSRGRARANGAGDTRGRRNPSGETQ